MTLSRRTPIVPSNKMPVSPRLYETWLTPAMVDCASHPPSRHFGVAGSEAATDITGEALASLEAAVSAYLGFLTVSALAIL